MKTAHVLDQSFSRQDFLLGSPHVSSSVATFAAGELAYFDAVQNIVAAVLERHLVVCRLILWRLTHVHQVSGISEEDDFVGENPRSWVQQLNRNGQ